MDGRTGKDAVDVVRSTPLLVSQNIATEFLLLPLDQLDVGKHSIRRESACEFN